MVSGPSDQSSGMDKRTPETRPDRKPTRLDEALRIIEEYAADLRAMINKLRQKMN